MTKDRLEQLKEELDMTRKLISLDIYFCIYDTDGIVQYIYPEDGDKDGIHIGMKFVDPTGKLDEVLATEKHIHNFVPMDRFGFYMEGNLIPVYDDGVLCGVISSAYVPMNQQQLAARELAVQAIYYLIMSVDMKNNNHVNRLYFDYEKQEFPTDAQHFDDFSEKSVAYVHPEDVAWFLTFTDIDNVRRRLQREKTITMECRLRSVSGDYRWAELCFTRAEDFEASADAYHTAVYMVRDIHERKSKELDILAQLERKNQLLFEQGMTDGLTGLYNRKGLAWFGEKMLADAKHSGKDIYVLVADLNGLKSINDRFGHEGGDNAIRAIAEMLREAAPEPAIVCRTGGDEFTVMAMLEKDSPLPDAVEQKLLKRMEAFNADSGLAYMVEASYGWDRRPASEIVDLDNCLNRADNKMYAMKSGRRLSGHLPSQAQSELDRRLGSVKQQALVLSADSAVHRELSELLDAGYLLSHLETVEDALQRLGSCNEMTLVFVDARLEGRFGISQFARELPEQRRQNVIPVLLMEREDPDTIAEAFACGTQDVLIRPYNTVLNQCRIKRMSQMGLANRKLGQLLEQQMAR